MEKVGKEGVITVEEARALETELDVVEGMQFDRGYLSPYFVTDPSAWRSSSRTPTSSSREEDLEHEGPAPAARAGRQAGPPLLIIAEDVEGEALATLVVNKLRGTLTSPPSRRRASAIAARRCSRTSPSSPAARSSARSSASSSRTSPQRPRPRQARQDRQGQHHHRRRRRQEGRHQGPRRADPRPDREHHLRLRPREAPGAPRQARRRRRGHQGRRGHRDRDEGEEGPRRGRAPRDPRGRRRGHRPRRRRGAAPRQKALDKAQARTTSSASASTSSAAPSRSPSARSPRTRASRARSSSRRSARARARSATTPRPASTATSSRWASSTRPRSSARAAERGQRRGLMLTTEALIADGGRASRPGARARKLGCHRAPSGHSSKRLRQILDAFELRLRALLGRVPRLGIALKVLDDAGVGSPGWSRCARSRRRRPGRCRRGTGRALLLGGAGSSRPGRRSPWRRCRSCPPPPPQAATAASARASHQRLTANRELRDASITSVVDRFVTARSRIESARGRPSLAARSQVAGIAFEAVLHAEERWQASGQPFLRSRAIRGCARGRPFASSAASCAGLISFPWCSPVGAPSTAASAPSRSAPVTAPSPHAVRVPRRSARRGGWRDAAAARHLRLRAADRGPAGPARRLEGDVHRRRGASGSGRSGVRALQGASPRAADARARAAGEDLRAGGHATTSQRGRGGAAAGGAGW
jgi:hypothetical protein